MLCDCFKIMLSDAHSFCKTLNKNLQNTCQTSSIKDWKKKSFWIFLYILTDILKVPVSSGCLGQHCGIGRKGPTCTASIPYGYWFPAAPFAAQRPANSLGKQAKTVQMFGPLPPMWEVQMKLLAPGFDFAQHWLWRPFGKWTKGQKISLCVPFSLSDALIFK